MKKYTVAVMDELGNVVFTSKGNSVIAGTAVGEDASVIFLPHESDEDSAIALVDVCEAAFTGGDDTDEDIDDDDIFPY